MTALPARAYRVLLLTVLLALAASVPAQEAGTTPTLRDEGLPMQVEVLRVDTVPGSDGGRVERFEPVTEALPGDVVEYRITVVNETEAPIEAGLVVVTVPIPEGVAYIENSAGPAAGDRALLEFSADGGESYGEPPVLVDRSVAPPEEYDAIRWTFLQPFEPGEEETVYYRVDVL